MHKRHSRSNGFATVEVLLIFLVLAILAAAGYFVFIHGDQKPRIPSADTNRFATYTLTNDKGEKFQILFYKNSKPEQYNFGGTTDMVLLSPPQVPNGLPVYVSLAGKANDSTAAGLEDVAKSNNCAFNSGETELFSERISSVNIKANFCSVSDGVGYFSFFGTSSSIYYMQILPASNNLSQTTENEARVIRSNPTISDAEMIAESFKPLPGN